MDWAVAKRSLGVPLRKREKSTSWVVLVGYRVLLVWESTYGDEEVVAVDGAGLWSHGIDL